MICVFYDRCSRERYSIKKIKKYHTLRQAQADTTSNVMVSLSNHSGQRAFRAPFNKFRVAFITNKKATQQ
jgi:hypothetical protein